LTGNTGSAGQLTLMLRAWSEGDDSVLEELIQIVHAELYRLARGKLAAERPGHLLQPTALVNEAFLRLMNGKPIDWKDRAHFFGVSARLMRQILVDFARAQNSAKRGSGSPRLDLGAAENQSLVPSYTDVVDVDTALQELAKLDLRQAAVVELRYFGGLENGEIAEVLHVSEDTVMRDWKIARTWLYSRLRLPHTLNP
jgi:RNA polymerase sigma-70 factor (ECF subfamily)